MSLYVGISSPSIGLRAARPDFMRWRYPFVVEWKKRALILNILNRKVSICRDFLSLYRSTGGTPRLHGVTISSFEFEWKRIVLILNILNLKVSICRDFLSLCRSTGSTPRLHEVTISICNWMNTVLILNILNRKSLYVGISSPSIGLQAAFIACNIPCR